MPFSKPINRRKFLSQAAAIAATSSLPLGTFAQHAAPKGELIKRFIPGTDEALPVVGIGAPDIFFNYREEGGKELSQQVLQAVIDMGGRLCDTPAPGGSKPNEAPPVFGEMMNEMGGIQNDLFLTTKISTPRSEPGRDAALAEAEWSLDYLGKDPIDLMLVHNMKDVENMYPVVKELKAEGRARYIGVSRTRTADFSALKDFMKKEKPDFVLLGYSPFQQEPADQDVMAIAQDLGIAMIGAEAFKAGEDGLFFSLVADVELPEFAKEIGIESWAQYSLKWIVSDPAITSVIVETSKAHHVVDNMTAAYGELPDQALRKKMSDFLLNLG